MRAFLCPLIVVVVSLPWRLNSHLTPSTNIPNNHEDIAEHQMLGMADESLEQRKYTAGSGLENVFSFSSSIVKQHLTSTSHSQQQHIRVRTSSGEGETLNQRTKRNVDDSQYNSSTPAEPGRQTEEKEITIPQRELLKPSESSLRPQATTTVQIQNTTEFVLVFTKNLQEDNLPQEMASPSDSQKHDDPQINVTDNTTNTNDLQTVVTTVQPSSMTQTNTSMVITATDFKISITGLSTKSVKTRQGSEITKEWTHGDTQGPELKTPSTVKPTVKTSTSTPLYTTRKTTVKLVPQPPSKSPSNDKHQKNPGAAVAAIIGTTFVFMFIAILVILIRKRKIQKRQLENPEWAGPSPFLDGDIQPNLPSIDESDSFNKRGFSQISISRYLSQRLSKHLTLGRNTNEDVFMGDILQGSTFARQSLNELQEPNGKPVGQDPTKTEENEKQPGPTSMDSPDTKSPAEETHAVTEDIQELTEQTDDISPSPSTGTGPVIKPFPTLVSIDLDSLSEEPAPLQTTDVGIVPPAPPLP
ncbi:protein EVI2B-like [Myxocyprinus asiaticus]|uniref:protein EVI2B-like n=1 Tax=Myxocyprinus asiaticus TaxID=70543 RepID=UPI002223748D|nr:protein EVI2B-like [Myxocyprinus asiaticus]